jgi:electron transfer flavoprotein alpha subunit
VNGVLVVAELAGAEPRPATIELIELARALRRQGAGPVGVALIGRDADDAATAVASLGVDEAIVVEGVPTPHFEAHVWQAALEALIAERAPAVVLAAHSVDSLGFAAALAARGRHGFASDVTALSWGVDGLAASRGAYGERLVAELDFPGKDTVVVLARAGARVTAAGAGSGAAAETGATSSDALAAAGAITRLDMELSGRERTERVELREPPRGDVDITQAELLLSIGRGIVDAERIPELRELASRMGATLSASRPLIDAGWIPPAQQVGQSGRTVAPRVYIALGISGAVQHLAGMSKSKTIIAVNSDPQAPIFGVAHYGAVADLFDVAAELERQFS